MADNSTLPVSVGTEVFANDDIGGVKYPRVKIAWGPDATANDTDVASGKPLPIQIRSSTGTAIDSGSGTGGPFTPRFILDSSQLSTLLTAAAAMSSGYQLVGLASDSPGMAAEDSASASGDVGMRSLVIQKATPADTAADGDYVYQQMSGGYTWVHDNKGLANKLISAAFTTLTRPANATPYTALDSISDNATAGSVTALSATISDVNDDPVFISEILINSTDTGLAGKRIRAYLYNSNPTSSTGVVNGDNAAFSNKKAGYVGSFSGIMETGFSDGCVGRLVPTYADNAAASVGNVSAGGFIVTKPTSGAQTLYIQYQAIDGFTPSANSTTIIGTARGWQGRAA